MQNLKILIVGSGVAGLTCAALLKNQGLFPKVIEKEKEEDFNKSGYMLGLLPLGGRVLNTINAEKHFYETSIEMENYEIHKSNGSLIKSYPLNFINENYGSYRGISRVDLINILLDYTKALDIRFGTTIKSLLQKENFAEVFFSDGSSEDFDLVIIADGLHSQTRKQILKEEEYKYYSTGWGGWVTWFDATSFNSYKEYWGAGSFLGIYPVKDKIGVFLGGPTEKIKKLGIEEFSRTIKNKLLPEHDIPHQAIDAFKEDKKPFFWEFSDCRSKIWHRGNTVLLGDAATGFLPTAGIGASMAMDSAAALVDELSRSDHEHLEYCLDLYAKRQKKRAEKAQLDSRKFGKMMFLSSPLIAGLRNRVVPFYSLKQMLSDLSGVMEGSV